MNKIKKIIQIAEGNPDGLNEEGVKDLAIEIIENMEDFQIKAFIEDQKTKAFLDINEDSQDET